LTILEPGRKRSRRPTGRQFVVATLWGVAVGIAVRVVVGVIV